MQRTDEQEEPDLSSHDHEFSPASVALLVVLALGMAFAALFATDRLDPVDLVRSGGHGPSSEAVADDFGATAIDPNASGYDGQQTYAIAREFPDLEAAAEHLDTPRYRLLRILPPAVASAAPSGGPTVYALLAINLLGIGLAVRAGGRLLHPSGTPVLIAVPAAAILLIGVLVTTVEPIAWGLTLTGVDLAVRSKHRNAVMVLVVAAFCRETAAVAALLVGAGIFILPRHPRRLVSLWYVTPAVLIAAWYLTLGQLVGGRAARTRTEPLDILNLDAGMLATPVVVATVGLLGVFAWRDVRPVATVCLGFTLWILVYDVAVLDWLAITRVNGLPVILGVLGGGRMIAARTGSSTAKTAEALTSPG